MLHDSTQTSSHVTCIDGGAKTKDEAEENDQWDRFHNNIGHCKMDVPEPITTTANIRGGEQNHTNAFVRTRNAHSRRVKPDTDPKVENRRTHQKKTSTNEQKEWNRDETGVDTSLQKTKRQAQ